MMSNLSSGNKSNDLSRLYLDQIRLINNILYKVHGDKLLIVVPETQQREIIESAHGPPLVRYQSNNKT